MAEVKFATWMNMVKTIEVKHEVIKDNKWTSLFY